MRGEETVDIVPAAARDRHGDATGAAPAETSVPGCIIWPRTSTELDRGEVIIEGLNVFLPPDSPLPGPKDRVRARGDLFEVDGVPGVYIKGTQTKGTLVVLTQRGT